MSTKVSVCMQDNWVFDETMKTLDSKRFPLLQLAEMHVMSDLVFGKYDNTDGKSCPHCRFLLFQETSPTVGLASGLASRNVPS